MKLQEDKAETYVPFTVQDLTQNVDLGTTHPTIPISTFWVQEGEVWPALITPRNNNTHGGMKHRHTTMWMLSTLKIGCSVRGQKGRPITGDSTYA